MLEKFVNKSIKKIAGQINEFLPVSYCAAPYYHRDRRGFIVSTTTRCNFHCPHCLRTEIDKNKKIIKDLPVSALEEALKEGAKLNFNFVSFTGGEPILHPQFEELISLTQKYGYKFNLATNGWLHQEYWDILKRNRAMPKIIFLSLDGVTAEVHDAVRNRPGSFEKLMETIKFYKSRNLPLMTTFCVTRKNRHQIEMLPDFCLGLGINLIKWAMVIPVYDESGVISAEHSLTDEERNEVFQKILNTQEKYKFDCAFTITHGCYPFPKFSCPILDNNVLYIDHDGGMLFCCDLNRECEDKPLIQQLGFEKSFKITLNAANEMKKKFLSDLLNSPRKTSRICDFCNKHIKGCLTSAIQKENHCG